MSALDYDVIVLGGGSAGSSAAAAAAAAGARTLMINDGELGGLCILRGCMPTKAMLASAHALHETSGLEPLGLRLDGSVSADFRAIMRRKDRLVERFRAAKLRSIESGGYEVLDARARFVEGGAVEAGGRRLRAAGYVIATGSTPETLRIPGIDDVPVWDSDEVMRRTELPRRLLVQGAGPVGLELAQFFSRVGSEVLLVNRSPLLSRDDAECGEILAAAFGEEKRLELAVPGAVERLAPGGDGLIARVDTVRGSREFEADALLMAVGRRAALGDLGLEHVGLDPVGGVLCCDAAMRTDRPAVYVAGDATGTFQILHLANREGAVAGHNAAVGRPERTVDYRLKMSVIFTDPPFATVGLTEQEARDRGIETRVARARFPETGRAITMDVRHGLWKLLADREGELIGSAILGPRADDLIHLVAILMHRRFRHDEILELPWYHPTLSEVMLELARDLGADTAN